MLQIITEKFFPPGERYVTQHRSVFFTNYRMSRGEKIETCVGTLLPSTDYLPIATLTCEIIEKQEKYPNGAQAGVFISTTGDHLLNDFSAVCAFFLNVTCSPDHDLARRLLLSERPSLGVAAVPSRLIGRMFEPRIQSKTEDAEAFALFVKKLVGLDRKSFVGAMRAIRQFIIGCHRIADDLNLAYTLFVTSIESLAQEFDGHVATWSDYDQRKRKRIDDALSKATDEVSEQVRSAVLTNEHVAASRRFRDFAIANVAPSFFREEAHGVARPISRPDLNIALRYAYDIRSRYVHSLQDIPRQLTLPDHAETIDADDRIALSFAGLARLARHIILQFVERRPTATNETFDYRTSLPGVVTVKLASHYWIANASGFDRRNARTRLGAFLRQITDIWMQLPDTALTDIRPILEKVEQLVPTLKKPSQRLPMLALYVLFNKFVSANVRSANWPDFVEQYKSDFDAPSIESFMTLLVIDAPIVWSIEQLEQLVERHLETRHTTDVIDAGRVLEAALLLVVAERNRAAGNIDRACYLIALAVEAHPGHLALRAFEEAFAATLPEINWRNILLPTSQRGDSTG